MTSEAFSAVSSLRDYMNDSADSDPSIQELLALRDRLLKHFSEIPESEHYAIAYVIFETGEVLSDEVKAVLERMVESTDEGAAVWSRALLYQLYGQESRLQEILERGSLENAENPGSLRALYPILYAASTGDAAAQRAVESVYRDPKVDSRIKDIILREYYI